MRKNLLWQIAFATIFIFGVVFAIDARAQNTRNKPSRRATNPPTRQAPTPKPKPTPTPNEVEIITLAEDTNGETANNTQTTTPRKKRQTSSLNTEQDYVSRSMNELTTELRTLSERVETMEEKQQQLVDLEILSRAEQRAEFLHGQLTNSESKEIELRQRLAQIEFEIRPENIERSTALMGTTRPDELREVRRQQLEAERKRIQDQLQAIERNRSRQEQAARNADMLVERLRNRLEENLDNPVPIRERPRRKAKETQTNNIQIEQEESVEPEPPDQF